MTDAMTTAEIGEIQIRELPVRNYLGEHFASPTTEVGRNVQGAFASLYSQIERARSRPAGPPFLIASPPKDGVMEIEVGAPCNPVPEPAPGQHAGKLDACRAAATLYRGPYERIGQVYGQVFRWIGEHGYRPAGAPREVYLNGPGDVQDSAGYLTEVVIPIQ